MSDKPDNGDVKVKDKRRVTLEDGEVKIKDDAPRPADEDDTHDLGAQPAEPTHEHAAGGHDGPQPMSFTGLVFSLATSAMMYLGDVADPDGKSLKDTVLAKQTIDLLGVLAEKTKGNLDAEEQDFLSKTLRDLRLRYVQVKR